MTRGHNSTWNLDLGHNLTLNQDPGVTIQRVIMTGGHISTWNHVPGSQFYVELWPRVKIPRLIMTPGHNSILNCDPNPGSQCNVEFLLGVKSNVEFRPVVIIQREIKTRGHNSTGVQIQSVGGVIIQWPPVSGVAIQHKKSVDTWAQTVESRPTGRNSMGSKFNPKTDNNNRRMDSQGMDGILSQ